MKSFGSPLVQQFVYANYPDWKEFKWETDAAIQEVTAEIFDDLVKWRKKNKATNDILPIRF